MDRQKGTKMTPHITRIIQTLTLAVLFAFVAVVGSISLAAAQGVGDGVVPDNNVARWAFLVGTFLPLAAAAIIRQTWRSEIKGGAVFALSAIAAFGTSFLAGDLQRGDFVSAALIILVTASITYKTFWQPTGIAPAIEERTG